MTTLRQSNMMHTTSSSHHNHSHDDNLDMLLEDLHSSVSRPGSSLAMNGPATSGYREVTRTVTNQGLNGPETSREYQIEYLNPANSTTVIAERGTSPNLDILTDTSDLPPGSKKMASYKVSTYQYKTSGGNPVHDTSANGDVRMRQNINELDSLLDDLHTAQKTGFAADNSSLVKKSSGYDSSLIEPIQTSTPKGGHVSRSVERKVYQEQRYGSVGRQSPAREIIKQDHSYRPDASPLRQRKEMYKYETKTTRSVGGNTREISPPSPPPIRSSSGHSPSRQGQTIRSYNYTSSSDQDIIRTPTMHHRSPSPTTHRSPSPPGKTVKSYNYSSNRTHEYTTDGGGYPHSQPQPPYRSPSPSSRRAHNYTTTTTTTNQETHRGPIRSQSPSPGPRTAVHSYNYSSSTKESKQEVPRSPPPHRSPSPVSFISPSVPNTKSTTIKTYNFEQSPRPQSPQPPQKFSPSDPSRTLNYQVSPPPNQANVYSYKYSSHTSSSSKYPPEEHVPLLPRPFPTPSPTPDQQQQPPKKLDDLMASFSDTEIQQHHYNESHRYTHQQPQQQPLKQHPQPVVAAESYPPPAPGPQSNANNIDHQKSKNVVGPPVYYPPGVELFSKKEEPFTQQQSGGGGGKMKAKAKAKYEYESKSKSKEKSKTGKTVVPVCLPVCCAMPCVIM